MKLVDELGAYISKTPGSIFQDSMRALQGDLWEFEKTAIALLHELRTGSVYQRTRSLLIDFARFAETLEKNASTLARTAPVEFYVEYRAKKDGLPALPFSAWGFMRTFEFPSDADALRLAEPYTVATLSFYNDWFFQRVSDYFSAETDKTYRLTLKRLSLDKTNAFSRQVLRCIKDVSRLAGGAKARTGNAR